MSDDGGQGLGASKFNRLYDHERELQLKRDAASELYGALEHIRELLMAYGDRYLEKAVVLADAALAKARAASPTPNPHHPPEGE